MWERRWIETVVRHRMAVLATVLAVTVAAGYSAMKVRFDADIEIWFLEDDENLVRYREFLDRFSSDEIVVLGVFADDIFDPELLGAIDRVTRLAEKAPHAHRARSLTNVKIVQSGSAGEVAIERLIPKLPKTSQQRDDLRARAMANPLLRDNLISADGQATAVIIELDPKGNSFDGKIAFVSALREIAQTHLPPGVEWHLAGSPQLDEAFFLYSERDFMVLGPAALLVVILATLLLFRRLMATVLCLAVVGLATVWVFGLIGMLGMKINLVTSSLVALILAVGVADSVHLLSDYYRELAAGRAPRDAVVDSTAALLVPCLVTSTTTAAGFLSLLTSNLKPIREFGWLAAVGVTVAFVLSVLVIPSVLSLSRAPGAASLSGERDARMSRFLRWLGRPSLGISRVVMALSMGVTAVSIWGITRINTDANPMNYFLPGDPVRHAIERIDEGMGGSTSVELLIQTRENGLKDPKILARLDALRQRIEGLPAIVRVFSVLDTLRETRRVFTAGASDALPGPDDHPHLAAQLYLFLEGDEDFDENVQDNYSVTRMSARVRLSAGHELTGVMPSVIGWLASDYGDDDLRVEVTGFIKLMSDMETYLFKSQIQSFLMAFAVITALMFLLLGSVRLGLFSMIPNLVPIGMGLAFMAAVGFALDPGTVMIGSMALGLVVDDTVHFLVRLRRNLAHDELDDAIAHTVTQVGRPIIMTSLILAGGFSTLGLGSFSPNVAFGLVSAVVIVLALVADLVLLPAALRVVRPRVSRATSA